MRLTDLLERVRPAGAPGASAEGETRHIEELAQRELAGIAEALSRFAADAADVVAAARAEAADLDRAADRRIQQIRASRADRIARVGTSVEEFRADSGGDDPSLVGDEFDERAERERARADQEIPRLVEAAIDVIWSEVVARPRVGGPR